MQASIQGRSCVTIHHPGGPAAVWAPSRARARRMWTPTCAAGVQDSTRQQVRTTTEKHARNSNGAGTRQQVQQPHRVFMFDPYNPGEVQEMLVQPHEDAAAAEELLQAAQHNGVQVRPLGNAQAEATGPGLLPLKAVNGAANGRPVLSARQAPAPAAQQGGLWAWLQQSLNGGNGNSTALGHADHNVSMQKATEMQKQLVNQLQREQTQVANLRQYEAMYKEWRVKAERLETDIALLHRMVAEKDAELSHGYKLLEASAAERSRLRHSYQASQEKAKQLQMSLAEAQQRALLAAPAQQQLGNGNGHHEPGMNGYHKASNGNGRGRAASPPPAALPGVVHTKIQELNLMAQSMATEMLTEVRSIAAGQAAAGHNQQ